MALSADAAGGDVTIVTIEGYCPFLTCLKPSPHDHHVCEVCDAVRYGNAFCDRCTVMSQVLGDDR